MSKELDVAKYLPLGVGNGSEKGPLYFKGEAIQFRIAGAPMPGARLALVPICPTGEFYREDLGYFTITKNDLFRIASSARERSDLLEIDYNHSTYNKNAAPTERIAAGWINRRSLFCAPWGKGYILMGWAYLTPDAALKRTKGELLYISPSLKPGRREIGRPGFPAGQEMGLQLVNVGLVDIPFFDMPPVALFSKSGNNSPRPLTFGAVHMEELKAAFANLLSTLGVAPDLIASGFDGMIQLLQQMGPQLASILTPAAAAPAADPAAAAPMAAVPPAIAPAAAAPAQAAAFQLLASMFPALMQAPQQRPQLVAPAPVPSPVQFGIFQGANGARFVARVQAQQMPQLVAPAGAPAPVDQNAALFGALQQLNAQMQQLGQQVNQGQQNAAFLSPLAFAPLSAPNQFGANMQGLVQTVESKRAALGTTVLKYQADQANLKRTIDYGTAMTEARNNGLLKGLE